MPIAPKKKDVEKYDRRGSGIMAPMHISPALQDIIGMERCSRSGAVQEIWKYIKKHKLQDPNNRRFFLPDDKMAVIFGTKKVYTMTMAKKLEDGKHFQSIGPKEIDCLSTNRFSKDCYAENSHLENYKKNSEK